MSEPIYKPVANGVYQNNTTIISVGNLPNQLAVSQKKARMSIWVGELPENWRLCELHPEGSRPGDANAVPVDDIERALRAAESILGIHREGRLLLRRVQKWLDGLPKEESEHE